MTKADFIAGVAEVAGISKKDAGCLNRSIRTAGSVDIRTVN